MKTSFKLLTIISVAVITTAPLHQSRAQLLVVNGDFQDTNGLTPTAGAPGWYDGVPAGWSSSTASLTFNVINYSSGNFGANVQTLGPASPFTPLYQSVGILDSTGPVTLSFSILGFSPTYGLAAAIYDAPAGGSPTSGTWTVLASASYTETSGGFQTLVAPNVAASTPVAVAFWRFAGSPGIDNVTAVPEPSTYALLVLAAGGLAAHVARRRRLR
jgi:hypothetical protein